MAERIAPLPVVTGADLAIVRATIETAHPECRVHGVQLTTADLTRGLPGGPVSASAMLADPVLGESVCCALGVLPLRRRRALAVLDAVEEWAEVIGRG